MKTVLYGLAPADSIALKLHHFMMMSPKGIQIKVWKHTGGVR